MTNLTGISSGYTKLNAALSDVQNVQGYCAAERCQEKPTLLNQTLEPCNILLCVILSTYSFTNFPLPNSAGHSENFDCIHFSSSDDNGRPWAFGTPNGCLEVSKVMYWGGGCA